MIDLFNFAHGNEAGVLAVDGTHGVAVVGPNDPPKPSKFDVTGPTLPQPPRLSIGGAVYVTGPTMPNPPQSK